MDIIKLKSSVFSKIWGGHTLEKYNKKTHEDNIGESWELSFRKEGPSYVCGGVYDKKPLYEIINSKDIGELAAKFPYFPTLIKLICADESLSVQVHPSDEYALKNENSYGKTEMWYILEAKPGAGIYLGFNKDVNAEIVSQKIKDNTLIEILNFIPVKSGDCFFVKSGTVHAIGAGITLFEVQQNSDITYRLYDWGKIDPKTGKGRTLHIEQSLKVLDYNKYTLVPIGHPLLGHCPYFATYECDVTKDSDIVTDNSSFASITFISGKGKINNLDYSVGDTFFIPTNNNVYISGNGKYLLTKLIK